MKNNVTKRMLGFGTAALVTASMLFAGCGSSADSSAQSEPAAKETTDAQEEQTEDTQSDTAEEKDAAETEPEITTGPAAEFSIIIEKDDSLSFEDGYANLPAVSYWLSQDWVVDNVSRKLELEFRPLSTGAEKDNLNTLMATGEYADVISMTYSTETAASLYEEGVAQDITEYVQAYMPNYMSWIEEHPQYKARVTSNIDGEQRIIQLFVLGDVPPQMWGGFQYRRDWLAKYGTNPNTGEAFSYTYENGEYSDDVVFPSGGTDPIYISDWEWMFEIFDEAMEDLGITDGYNTQLYYPGYIGTGDFTSGFGASSSNYMDEDGVVHYGGYSDSMRAYIECMSAWFAKGWIDPGFEERTSDMFFKIDSASIYSGKVGSWYGTEATLDANLNSASGDALDPLNDCMVFGAPQPINDVYGDASTQGHEPFCYYANGIIGASFVITDKADKDDLPVLLTAFDYLYTPLTGRMASYGFSEEQQAEIQDAFYIEHGLVNGAYQTEIRDGEEYYVLDPARNAEDDLGGAINIIRVPHLSSNKNVVQGSATTKSHSVSLWTMYDNYGMVGSDIEGMLTPDQTAEKSLITTNITTFMEQEVPSFITGRRDVNDDVDWAEYVEDLKELGPDTVVDYLNEALGN